MGELGIPIIDIKDSFAEDDDPTRFFFGWDKHYTEEGYKAAADAVLRQIRP